MIKTFKKIFDFSGVHRNTLKKSVVFSVIHSIFDFLQILALAIVLNGILRGITEKTIWMTLGIMFVSIIGKTICSYISHFSQTKVGYFMCADKRIHIGNQMKYLPMGYFNNNSLGSITSSVTTIMGDIENNAPIVFTKILHGFIHAIVIMIGVTVFDLRIGLIVFIGIVLFVLANAMLQKKSYVNSPKRQKAQEKLVEATLEYVQGISVVKAFNMDDNTNKKINQAIKESRKGNILLEKTFIPYTVLQQLVLRINSVVVIFVAILFYVNGTMELFKCLLMVISAFMIYSQLESAGSVSALLRMLDVSMKKVNEIDTIPIMDICGKGIIPKNYDIKFNNVSFSYGDKKILKNINLKIPEKTTTAIVGPSGSGKSTLCNLIARFWDVNEGSITIGNRNIKEYTLDSLLKNISMVFQNVYLFQDTIANNIKFGNSNATMEEVIKAAKKACCHEFIKLLPHGYNTIIGEGGASISGGEKQRISIARAILKDAPIIILDEATSNIDAENESRLQQAIEELTRDKTIIMIAHRLKTVKKANQIIVLNDGKIVQKGIHDELINKEGIYANFIGVRKKAIGWKILS
ncbi:ABC transporter ATP-binding protein [Clostridium sporogenes]|uniref:ABC transporter ATP-binding protein n=1 Tax=Clostridium sporogenes TaxID=1509 RepID=A0AAE4FJN9_CLOSG|nr:ABC transporter ATP-binding protein [Clostridium sporogenes]MDS1003048.1 ABC transporter ATP-binding protein [Clostridium sporogenes]